MVRWEMDPKNGVFFDKSKRALCESLLHPVMDIALCITPKAARLVCSKYGSSLVYLELPAETIYQANEQRLTHPSRFSGVVGSWLLLDKAEQLAVCARSYVAPVLTVAMA